MRSSSVFTGESLQVVSHLVDPGKPGMHDRCVFLLFPHADFRAEMEVADVIHQGLGQGEALVLNETVIPFFFQYIQQDQYLVQRERADGMSQK
jgi:hypothetical protein